MQEDELIEKAYYIAKETAHLLLQEIDTVPPYNLMLDKDGENPVTYFAGDENPGADFDKCLELSIVDLAQKIQTSKVGVIALATILENGDQNAIGIQIETAEAKLFVISPCQKVGDEWQLSDPEPCESLLLNPIWQ